MDKNQLKEIIKPLIKDCIREILLEESGVLSKIVSEVAIGLSDSRIVMNESQSTKSQNNSIDFKKSKETNEIMRQRGLEKQKEMEEKMSKITKATGFGNVFEGVQPLKDSGASKMSSVVPSQGSLESQGTALKGLAPDDPGVNIQGIMNVAGGKGVWSAMTNFGKKKVE